MIRLEQVEKSYPVAAGRTWVLRNVMLTIAQGEFISIVGPSGSGKSSLLNVLGLMDAEWQGKYWFEALAVHNLAPKQRQALQREQVGFIFQHYHLIDDLTVHENLDLPLSYRDIKSAERKARVGDILDRFEIVGKKDLYPRQLSGGQQQLVAVARAAITRPRLLLADEPTGALHSTQGRLIMELLKELHAQGSTVVLVTHSQENAAYAQRTLEIRDGWLSHPSKAG